ncbi:MAG: GH3 auxin-responsive promoter family protein [Bacteroidia bacterium]|nr:GH3 auxin-responsive promoter family protein [Bacteroidia bacterium]MDW8159222.1 GH3 auxin-responsive promoter family protein [Bacteroidia bacterium]
MLLPLLSPFIKNSLTSRLKSIEVFKKHPLEAQQKVFQELLNKGKKTIFGKDHSLEKVNNYEAFQKQVPLRSYENLYSYIERALKGEKNVLWPGVPLWFSKSSGTTNARSKYIPITPENLHHCNYTAGKDMLAAYLLSMPHSQLPKGKILSIIGSHEPSPWNRAARCGDVSAVLAENMPWYYALGRAPSKKVALLADWEEKITRIVEEAPRMNITGIAGVPTWVMVIIEKLLAATQKSNLLEVWPNLEVFFHGAVHFAPYASQFQKWIPSNYMQYRDVYNASEGFFAFQEEPNNTSMLLLLSHGIFYEFLPLPELEKENPTVLPLEGVECNIPYALIITTNSGLWRYLIGDTIMFTSKNPYTIRIIGRTKSYINVFGEEVMVENAERALAHACKITGSQVQDYTVAPIFLEAHQKGRHQWLIEFTVPPSDITQFTAALDEALQNCNSDYAAKRQKNLALELPLVQIVPSGTFYQWLQKRGRVSSQTKVPRLSNERKYVEEILALLNQTPPSVNYPK